jgi:hypothetical protein
LGLGRGRAWEQHVDGARHDDHEAVGGLGVVGHHRAGLEEDRLHAQEQLRSTGRGSQRGARTDTRTHVARAFLLFCRALQRGRGGLEMETELEEGGRGEED